MARVPTAKITTALLVALTSACASSSVDGADERDGSVPSASISASSPSEHARPMAEPPARAAALVADGEPRRALLTIPAIGVRALPVVPYRGSPDDGPGTRIQNGGVAASPFGPHGGIGPGGIGNYIVTAHRTSSTRAFAELPSLEVGDRILVVVGKSRYVYRITETRHTSFRSARSLARQSAEVPGHLGQRATQAMITLSTCATQEDHARGNYWADEFDNPEHRIDKIGVLVATRPA